MQSQVLQTRSRMLLGILLLALLLGVTLEAQAINVNLPRTNRPNHAGATVHLDLNPATPVSPLGTPFRSITPSQPRSSFSFTDNANSLALLHWEVELTNVFGFPVFLYAGFYFPGAGSPILGRVALGGFSTFDIDIHVQDNAQELGAKSVLVNSGLSFTIGFDTAVIEPPALGPQAPGSFTWEIHSPGNFFPDSTLASRFVDPRSSPAADFAFVALSIPEPSTYLLLLAGLLALLGRRRHAEGSVLTMARRASSLRGPLTPESA